MASRYPSSRPATFPSSPAAAVGTHAEPPRIPPFVAWLLMVCAAAASTVGVYEIGRLQFAAAAGGAPLDVASSCEVTAAAPRALAKILTIDNTTTTEIEYSTTLEHAAALCHVVTSGLNVYVVDEDDTDTSDGDGPFCDKCSLGPNIPPLGRAWLRTSASSGDVSCTFYDSPLRGAALGTGGGISLGLADSRYVKIDGSGNPDVTSDFDVTGWVFSSPGGSAGEAAIYAWDQTQDDGRALMSTLSGVDSDAYVESLAYGPTYVGNGYCHAAGDTPGNSEIALRGADATGVAICSVDDVPLRLGVSQTTSGSTFVPMVELTRTSAEIDGVTLHVDASNNRVGIGTATPDFALQVEGATNGGVGVDVRNTQAGSAAQAGITVFNNNSRYVSVNSWSSSFTASGLFKPNSGAIGYAGGSGNGLLLYTDSGGSAGATISPMVFAVGQATGVPTTNEKLRLTQTEVVVNDAAQPTADFRVEGDTNPNLLVCDASADTCSVGGMTSSATTWEVSISGAPTLTQTGNSVSWNNLAWAYEADNVADLGTSSLAWNQLFAAQIQHGASGGSDVVALNDNVEFRDSDAADPDYLQLPRSASTTPGTPPACTLPAHNGRLFMMDDEDDALSADICVCFHDGTNHAMRSIIRHDSATGLALACLF